VPTLFREWYPGGLEEDSDLRRHCGCRRTWKIAFHMESFHDHSRIEAMFLAVIASLAKAR